MSQSRYSFPTTIHFGPGTRNLVAAHLKAQGYKRPLLVTDKALARLDVFRQFRSLLDAGGLTTATFSDISSNPVKSEVGKGVEQYRDAKCDCIVGFGGGAALDIAKAIALMVNHPGDLFDYEDDKPNGRPINQQIPYWVALPTTAGTGSEVGRSAVVSDDKTHQKKIIFSPRLLAQVIFADPELTVGLPPKITAATGMDALTHLVEAFLSKGFHPIADGIALEGLHLVNKSLVKAVKDGNDLEARGDMLMASMMGAIAFQKGLGLTHSCAHPLSTVADMHHGLANGIMITYALPFNIPAVAERFVRLGEAVGLKDGKPEGFIEWLKAMKKEVGIPERLSDAGIRADQIDRLSDLAQADVCHGCNPRPVTRADFHQIFTAAL